MEKLVVAVELKNGDLFRVECSSIEYDALGIELWGSNTYSNVSLKYKDISSMSIFVESEQESEILTFKSTRIPKVEREEK